MAGSPQTEPTLFLFSDLHESDTKNFDETVVFAYREKNSQRGRKQCSQAFAQFDTLGGSIHAELLIDGIRRRGHRETILCTDPNVGQLIFASTWPDNGVADHFCSNDRR